MPEHIQVSQGIYTIFYAAMIEANAGKKVEDAIVKSIIKSWDDTLLVLYANVQTDDYKKQLQTAEQWLSVHSTSSVLLNVVFS